MRALTPMQLRWSWLSLLAAGCSASAAPSSTSPATPARSALSELAGEPNGCWWNDGCYLEGHCSPDDRDKCLAMGDDCRPSRACVVEGRCAAIDGECVVTRDEDCKRAAACGFDGLCVMRRDRCEATQATCEASVLCRTQAKCSARNGECLVASDSDCAKSDPCADEGKCALVKVGYSGYECRPRSDQHCKDSKLCDPPNGKHLCKEEGNECVPAD